MKKSTARALIECRRRGWRADLVERSVPTGGNQLIRTRKDFLGFADILGLDGDAGVIAIQACTTDVGAHLLKMETDEAVAANVRHWLDAGNRLYLWAFRKLKVKRGGKAYRWTLRELAGTLGANERVQWTETAREDEA